MKTIYGEPVDLFFYIRCNKCGKYVKINSLDIPSSDPKFIVECGHCGEKSDHWHSELVMYKAKEID